MIDQMRRFATATAIAASCAALAGCAAMAEHETMDVERLLGRVGFQDAIRVDPRSDGAPRDGPSRNERSLVIYAVDPRIHKLVWQGVG